jgi:predicted metal-binding protein
LLQGDAQELIIEREGAHKFRVETVECIVSLVILFFEPAEKAMK